MASKKLKITDVTLRDANQSLLATRMRIDDLLPIARKMDQVGFHSLETWGGATFDACIRFLNEDPWERLCAFTKAMPNTPQQMLLRGQNLLGYRHYADDVVEKFVERSAECGIEIFRIFDALNDTRNLKKAINTTIGLNKHAQGTMCYTTSPVHTLSSWIDLAKRLEDLGVHSLCIKDMAGLLDPYTAFSLVKELKKNIQLPIQLHTHATTGFSTPTLVKAVEAGVDAIDTAMGSMSMTYGHSPTNTMVHIFEKTSRNTGLDTELLEEIDFYFSQVRQKYAKFEGSLRGIDSRILKAQVPGGMLTNMESQLKEQKALDKFDQVLDEIPKVREDLGFIPLVTPSSQIVGTQAVANVITGKRYHMMTKETKELLLGHYGQTPAPVNLALQQQALKQGEKIISKRPADYLENEWDSLCLHFKAAVKKIGLDYEAYFTINNVLIYALFSNVALDFFKKTNAEPKNNENEQSSKISQANQQKTKHDLFAINFNHAHYVISLKENGDFKDIIHLNKH